MVEKEVKKTMRFRRNDRNDDPAEGDPFGFGGLFEEFDDHLRRMRHYMDEVLQQHPQGSLPSPEEGGPWVYGWSLRWDGGKPHIEEFGNVKGPAAPGQPGLEPGTREPLMDVIETDKTVKVTAEVPGVERGDIDLETTGTTLTIRVGRKERKYHKEIALPAPVKPDSAKASCKNGVLEVVLEKAEAKPRGKKVPVD